ncbi:hypothetical protein FN846DRAFT_359163 [Sphaerosporella brunnea]|uniref:Uncharacterized protein n=1 Tax=Sphaerosporella brunnea TaxID=1250544 RepID=A0A5J5F6E0_9PEZI|nr:hypothetical protein FN846DRAFT_359163 [Sphaerosporella brunnea]
MCRIEDYGGVYYSLTSEHSVHTLCQDAYSNNMIRKREVPLEESVGKGTITLDLGGQKIVQSRQGTATSNIKHYFKKFRCSILQPLGLGCCHQGRQGADDIKPSSAHSDSRFVRSLLVMPKQSGVKIASSHNENILGGRRFRTDHSDERSFLGKQTRGKSEEAMRQGRGREPPECPRVGGGGSLRCHVENGAAVVRIARVALFSRVQTRCTMGDRRQG